jgi:hypothetical protein
LEDDELVRRGVSIYTAAAAYQCHNLCTTFAFLDPGTDCWGFERDREKKRKKVSDVWITSGKD